MGIPFDIHNDIFPSVFFQMLCHKGSILAHLFFGDRGIVVIVAVPSHRRMFGKDIFVHCKNLL